MGNVAMAILTPLMGLAPRELQVIKHGNREYINHSNPEVRHGEATEDICVCVFCNRNAQKANFTKA